MITAERMHLETVVSGKSATAANDAIKDVVGLLKTDPLLVEVCEASMRQDFKTVRWLSMQEADLNAVSDDGGFTALICCVYFNRFEGASLIIKWGANLNAPNADEEVPVHFLNMQPSNDTKERLAMAKLLLDNGADLTAIDGAGKTACDKAIATHRTLLSSFLEYYGTAQCIHDLAKDENWKGVQGVLLNGGGANLPHKELMYTPLIAAVYNDDVQTATVLLNLALVPNDDDSSLIESMRINDKLADVNFKGRNDMTALHYAAQQVRRAKRSEPCSEGCEGRRRMRRPAALTSPRSPLCSHMCVSEFQRHDGPSPQLWREEKDSGLGPPDAG